VSRASRSSSVGLSSSSSNIRGSPTNGGSVGGPGAHSFDPDSTNDEYDISRINERRAQS
jgi:hypothetical protein